MKSLIVVSMFSLLLWPGVAWKTPAVAADSDQVKQLEALQKKMQEVQGHGPSQSQGSLKRRDLKGQPMSQGGGGGEAEGLTPEQQQMYEELLRSVEQLKQNIKKRDEALEQLMPGSTK
jgi:hypothetical protein